MNILMESILGLLPDKTFLSIKFRYRLGYWMNWNNPKTYNEKLQWMKVFYHKRELAEYVDKYKVKEKVGKLIGEEYVIPTLGLWDNAEDIDFKSLPNQFVLKCTHDSGSIVICKDKTKFDVEKAKETLRKALQKDSFKQGREYPYRFVQPRVIAEEYMEDQIDLELRDYKFFVFNGIAKAMFIATDRENRAVDTCFDFYDMDFNHLDLRHGHPNSKKKIEKPTEFEKMKKLAEKLGSKFPHVRVDFYQVNGRVYFGEMTFYHHCGFMPFDPEDWDKTFGEWFVLPEPCNE